MVKPRKNLPTWVIIHHTATNNSFEIDNEYHRRKWNFKSELGFYLGYHYWISKSGEIKQARREDRESAAVIGMNTKSISIALQGNFNATLPTDAQKETLKKLLKELTKKWNIPVVKIVPHRYFSRTDCYGKKLKNDWAQQILAWEYNRSDNKQEIELLEKQINIIEKIIRAYVRLIAFFKKKRSDN